MPASTLRAAPGRPTTWWDVRRGGRGGCARRMWLSWAVSSDREGLPAPRSRRRQLSAAAVAPSGEDPTVSGSRREDRDVETRAQGRPEVRSACFLQLDEVDRLALRGDPQAIETLLGDTNPSLLFLRPAVTATLLGELGRAARGRLLHRWSGQLDTDTFARLYVLFG
jgi:hypothetical protein